MLKKTLDVEIDDPISNFGENSLGTTEKKFFSERNISPKRSPKQA